MSCRSYSDSLEGYLSHCPSIRSYHSDHGCSLRYFGCRSHRLSRQWSGHTARFCHNAELDSLLRRDMKNRVYRYGHGRNWHHSSNLNRNCRHVDEFYCRRSRSHRMCHRSHCSFRRSYRTPSACHSHYRPSLTFLGGSVEKSEAKSSQACPFQLYSCERDRKVIHLSLQFGEA